MKTNLKLRSFWAYGFEYDSISTVIDPIPPLISVLFYFELLPRYLSTLKGSSKSNFFVSLHARVSFQCCSSCSWYNSLLQFCQWSTHAHHFISLLSHINRNAKNNMNAKSNIFLDSTDNVKSLPPQNWSNSVPIAVGLSGRLKEWSEEINYLSSICMSIYENELQAVDTCLKKCKDMF